MKIIKYIFIYIIAELVCLYLLRSNVSHIYYILVSINSIITFYIIKSVEKIYYKKYNKLNSLLYNLCPLIGVSIMFIILSNVFNNMLINYLRNYYIITYILAYIINAIYLIISKLRHS